MPTNYKPLIQSGFGVGISGQHVYVESGLPVVVSSGLHVQISGQHVFVESGVHVVADIAESGLHVQISGQHVFVESGVHVVADIAESGIGVQVQSGLNVIVESGVHIEEVAVLHSGAVTVDSGLSVIVESGLGVSISGQHVFVESGVYVTIESGIGVTATVTVDISGTPVIISGQPVTISGDHVFVESGAYVVIESGIGVTATVSVDSGLGVLISGQHVYIEMSPGSGYGGYPYNPETDDDNIPAGESRETPVALLYAYESMLGAWKRVEMDIYGGINVHIQSGAHVQMSGQHVFVESGVHVVAAVSVDSGLGVLISGQHVFIESGAHVVVESGIGVVTDQATAGSGQVIHVGCADKIRTGKLVQVVGGTSGGANTGSGGMSLCVSGYWCSGPIHTIILKNLADNDPVYIGEVNCKPYSGYGFLLAATEAINLDYCDVCNVYVFGMTSGQFITWIGTDY